MNQDGTGLSEKSGAVVGAEVWFRLGRMHGNPPERPMRATVTKVRDNGRIDVKLLFERGTGTAAMVAHIDSLPDALKDQQACWW